MFVARTVPVRALSFRVPTRPIGSFKSAPSSRTNLFSANNRLVSRQQVKHRSSVGLLDVVSGDLRTKWNVTKVKKPKTSVLHPAPKQLIGDSGKLASVLYSVLVDKYGDNPTDLKPPMDRLDKDLQRIDLVIKGFPEYQNLFELRSKDSQSEKRITELLDGLKVGEETKKFVELLQDLRAVNLISRVARDFNTIVKAVNGEVEFTLTTAQPLTDAELQEWKRKLSLTLLKGETVVLHTKVDPSIISGYAIKSDLLNVQQTGLEKYKNFKETFKTVWDAYQGAMKARQDPKFDWRKLEETQKALAQLLGKPNIQLENEPAPFTPPKTEKQLLEDLRKNGATVTNLAMLGVKFV